MLYPFLIVALFTIFSIYFWKHKRELKNLLITLDDFELRLKEEKSLLETKIEERTKELKSAQMKEMSHFRQLAEFGLLSSGLFHELANPITAINLNIEQMSDTCRQNPHWQIFDNNIEKTIKAARKMGNFLNSVRKQIAKQEEKSHFSLNQEIEEVLEILEFKANRYMVSLIFETDKEFFLFNNQVKFHQLASNLISNAIDSYNKAEIKENKSVIISLKEIGYEIIFSIKDNGCGLSQELQEKIFEPFFSTKDFNHGIGIGLTLVKSITENDFNGQIEIKSSLDKGTKFIVHLPTTL